MLFKNFTLSAVATLALILGSQANAGVIYSSIDDVDGVYNPVVAGDALEVNPAGFDALINGSGMDMDTATLNVTISAMPGEQITGISFSEAGDYTIGGSGTASAELSYSTMIGGVAGPSGSSTSSVSGGAGVWTNSFNANFGSVTTSVDLSLTNKLTATGTDVVDLAFIKKKVSDGITVTTAPIPEPSAAMMTLLGLVALVGIGRRR